MSESGVRNARRNKGELSKTSTQRRAVVVEEEEAEFRAKKTQHFTLPCCCGRLDSFFAILRDDFSCWLIGDLEDCFLILRGKTVR